MGRVGIMTPFEISILLHYATTEGVYYPQPSTQQTLTEIAFVSSGYLRYDPAAARDNMYLITDKGRFYVAALQAVPELVIVFVISEQPEKEFHEGDKVR